MWSKKFQYLDINLLSSDIHKHRWWECTFNKYTMYWYQYCVRQVIRHYTLTFDPSLSKMPPFFSTSDFVHLAFDVKGATDMNTFNQFKDIMCIINFARQKFDKNIDLYQTVNNYTLYKKLDKKELTKHVTLRSKSIQIKN